MNYNDERKDKALREYADLMIDKIKKVDAGDWKVPWINTNFAAPPENIYGRRYTNSNLFMLSLLCEKEGYRTPVFITFPQCNKEGIRIKKGEHAFPVMYYDLKIKDKEGKPISLDEYRMLSKDEKENYTIKAYMKTYNVFNLDQTDFAEKQPERWEGLLGKFTYEKNAQGDGYINPDIDLLIRENKWVCPIVPKEQDKAFYSLTKDCITVPIFDQFPDKKEFYFTTLHEMAHSTGHSTRLNRIFGSSFGDEKYAREELVAELSSAFVGKQLGMSSTPRKENAQYLKSWLSALEGDPNFIYSTLKDVQRASSMMEDIIQQSSVKEGEEKSTGEPVIKDIKRDTDRIVYIEGIDERGEAFRSIAYKRGDSYSYTTGSIIDGNLKNHVLDAESTQKVMELQSKGPEKIEIATSRKSIHIEGKKATITFRGKEYPAEGITKTLKEHGISPTDISKEQWEKLLKGQGIPLKKGSKSLFSIYKAPAGYSMKVLSMMKDITNSSQAEAAM